MRRIGVIGGMGPAATIDLYSKIVSLTPALKDQEHIPVIIDSYPQIEDRTAFILGRGPSPLSKLKESARRLEDAGAKALVMPCNTAHFFAEDICRAVSIPLIHIARCAGDALVKNYPQAKKIGLMATTGTKKARVYEEILSQRGFEIAELSPETENSVMECIYDGVKAGRTEKYAGLFQKCVEEAALSGAEVLIAACTEIPLFLDFITTKVPFMDATLELARASVNFALENESS